MLGFVVHSVKSFFFSRISKEILFWRQFIQVALASSTHFFDFHSFLPIGDMKDLAYGSSVGLTRNVDEIGFSFTRKCDYEYDLQNNCTPDVLFFVEFSFGNAIKRISTWKFNAMNNGKRIVHTKITLTRFTNHESTFRQIFICFQFFWKKIRWISRFFVIFGRLLEHNFRSK